MTRCLSSLVCGFVFALAPAACSAEANSQSYVWKNVAVGGGGFIPGIVFSRVEKGLVYLRSDMGGFYRWDNTRQIWLPLNDAQPESTYQGGESIAPDPVDANIVYAAAGMYRGEHAAMLRSHDRGQTWETSPVPFSMGGNDDGRGCGERLAVDPNSTNILFFGSRHDGLMKSVDHSENWSPVASFPWKGTGYGDPRPAGAGLSFVVFDPHGSSRGTPTRTIFVGCTDPGSGRLFRSDDAGATWTVVTGGPAAEMLPLQAQIDDAGLLYITYSDNVGPNGAKSGVVYVLDTHSGRWTDITPAPGAGGGYCGISLDREHPGTLAVTTMDRWHAGDTVFRTTDGGKTWNDIQKLSQRDVSATPFLYWGKPEPRLGWWMCAVAIDPFDSNHVAYGTGATMYATQDFSDVSKDKPTYWKPWVKGIEQTAIVTLCSPPAGAPLLSGFGDIDGFVHWDLDQSPPQGMYSPSLGTTLVIDYAARTPNVLVRSGEQEVEGTHVAFSEDSGRSWQLLRAPESDAPASNSQGEPAAAPRSRRGRRRESPAVEVSADGQVLIISSGVSMRTTDRGATWTAIKGLPEDARPVADRVDPSLFYAIDFRSGQLYSSDDGASSFHALSSTGLPQQLVQDRPGWTGASWPLKAAPGHQRELWYVSQSGLYRSEDGGSIFQQINSNLHIEQLSFGKAPAGGDEPALFAIGQLNDTRAIWRSDDSGHTWIRVNDSQHEWGRRFRCISGDPRIFGRVYVGTDGRAILYGDIAK